MDVYDEVDRRETETSKIIFFLLPFYLLIIDFSKGPLNNTWKN